VSGKRTVLAGLERWNETHYVSRNALSVQLPNGMLQSNHIASRKFRGTAGGVIGNFCVVDPQKKSTLLP
jgi:hypothetical protein